MTFDDLVTISVRGTNFTKKNDSFFCLVRIWVSRSELKQTKTCCEIHFGILSYHNMSVLFLRNLGRATRPVVSTAMMVRFCGGFALRFCWRLSQILKTTLCNRILSKHFKQSNVPSPQRVTFTHAFGTYVCAPTAALMALKCVCIVTIISNSTVLSSGVLQVVLTRKINLATGGKAH